MLLVLKDWLLRLLRTRGMYNRFLNELFRYNIAFTCLLLLGRVNGCLDLLVKAGKIPEAVFMARSYAPSRVSELLTLWYVSPSIPTHRSRKQDLSKTNPKIAQSLADPAEYPNLFEEIEESLKAERYFQKEKTIDDLPEVTTCLDKFLINF